MTFIESKLIRKWREPRPNRCGSCGFLPVRLDTTLDNGAKEFALTCPNVDCNEHWKSPAPQLWQRSKAEAVKKWNEANPGKDAPAN